MLDGKTDMGKTIKIDKASGLLATEHTPESQIEERVFADPHSILYYVKRDYPLDGPPKKPEKDPQFELWESRVREWWASTTKATSTTLIAEPPPTESDNLHIPENLPKLAVVTPGNNQTIMEPLLIVRLKVSSPLGVSRAEYYIDDNLFYINSSYPFNLEKKIDFLNNGFHNLKIKACDDVDNCTTRTLEFNLVLENNPAIREIKISLVAPSSGLAVSNIDFPLSMKLNINYPESVVKINFYYLAEDSEEPIFISTIEPVEKNIAGSAWDDIPVSGTYKVYGEAIGWAKQEVKSDQSIIIVNNIKEEKEE